MPETYVGYITIIVAANTVDNAHWFILWYSPKLDQLSKIFFGSMTIA